MNKYIIERTTNFKKQYKKISKRNNFDKNAFIEVLNFLVNGENLPEKYCNHLLEPKRKRNMGMPYKTRLIIALFKKR